MVMKQGLDGIFSNRIMIENINLTMNYRRLLTRIFLLGNFSCTCWMKLHKFHIFIWQPSSCNHGRSIPSAGMCGCTGEIGTAITTEKITKELMHLRG